MGTSREDLYTFFIISHSFPRGMGNISDKIVEKIITHTLCSILFLSFFANHAVYEIMWKNFVQLGRPQMTIWRTHIVCWVPKATNTHTGCVVHIALPLQQWLHERASLLSHMHFLSCYVVLYSRFVPHRQLMAYYGFAIHHHRPLDVNTTGNTVRVKQNKSMIVFLPTWCTNSLF